MAGDVATAGAAGTDVTRVHAGQQEQSEPELPAAENGVASAAAAPADGPRRRAGRASGRRPDAAADPAAASPPDAGATGVARPRPLPAATDRSAATDPATGAGTTAAGRGCPGALRGRHGARGRRLGGRRPRRSRRPRGRHDPATAEERPRPRPAQPRTGPQDAAPAGPATAPPARGHRRRRPDGSSGDTSAAAAGTAAVRRRLARLGAPRGGGSQPGARAADQDRARHAPQGRRAAHRARLRRRGPQHAGQVRKSGDPFITHPLAVATILAELGMNSETLCAALLHDTIEDTDYTLAELRREFGDDVATLVDGVTKLDKVKYGEAAQAETVRKMVVAMSRDIRVLVIKLADRLHNMRTLRYLPREKQEQKSREVLEIFAPLAHRLGMNNVKWELEDLAFSTLFPKRYDEIARLVSERAPRRDVFMQDVIEAVSADMREAKIKAFVTGRPKHYYSVYQKMIARNVGFDDIYDLVGIRVLVDSVRDCYAALGTVHARWNPVPGRFKDYIAMPKFNLYQSLHTTVIGPEGKPVELQIRTWGMHQRAEYGVAAHWKYKEETTAAGGRGTADLAWLRQLVDWQRETADPAEFLDVAPVRPRRRRGVRVHPARRGDRAAAGRLAGGLRVRDPHRGGPPDHRRAGQRPPGRAGEPAEQRRHR